MQLAMLFVACLIASNIFETKQIAVGPVNLTGGLLIFPITYIICDCICEVWGYRRVCLVIWTGFLLNFIFMGAGALVDAIPGAPYYENGEGFHAIFGLAPRITLASCIAFLAGSFINARVLSGMKVRTGGKKLPGREGEGNRTCPAGGSEEHGGRHGSWIDLRDAEAGHIHALRLGRITPGNAGCRLAAGRRTRSPLPGRDHHG